MTTKLSHDRILIVLVVIGFCCRHNGKKQGKGFKVKMQFQFPAFDYCNNSSGKGSNAGLLVFQRKLAEETQLLCKTMMLINFHHMSIVKQLIY